MFSSLRGKFIVIFLLVTVTAVVISSGYARVMQRQYTLDRAATRNREDLRQITSEIQTVLQWVTRDLFLLRDLPQMKSFLSPVNQGHKSESFKAIESAFLAIANNHRIFHQVRFVDTNGQEVVRVNFDGKKAVLVPPEELQFKGHRYYVQESINLEPGEIYVSPLDLNIEHGQIQEPYSPVIRYATPVVDENGHIRGVIVLNVRGVILLNILERQQEATRYGEHYFLVDPDGYFLFHPDATKQFSRFINPNETLGSNEPDLVEFIERQMDDMRVIQSRQTNKETLFGFRKIPLDVVPDDNKLARSGSGKDLFADPDTQNYWYLISSADDEDFLMGFQEYINGFVPFTLLLIGSCVIVGVFVAWSMARPVISLAEAAREIQHGDLSARTTVYSSDEMGELGHLFNSMASHLEESVGQLSESEAKYRKIFENSRDCHFVADCSFLIKDLNPAGRELFGLSEKDSLPRMSLGCCLHPVDGDPVDLPQLICDEMSRIGYVKELETSIQRKDGSERICLITATTMVDQDGAFAGYEGILRDITEKRKRKEQAQFFRQKLNEEILLAEERERKDLSRLLHEELAQNLALVHMKLEEAEESTCEIIQKPRKRANCCHELHSSKELIELMISQVRTMIFNLYPAILDEQGLVPAIRWYANHFTKRTGIDVTVFDHTSTLVLGETIRIYLYRSIKELLHNIAKHADCSEVLVSINRRDNNVRLIVDDGGKGFDTNKVLHDSHSLHGIGLATIKEWMTDIGGNFIIESVVGQGTRVVLDVPTSTDKRGKNAERIPG